jgi:hypothetical protein
LKFQKVSKSQLINIINVKGASKQVVGQTAAIIRGYRKPEPYKGKVKAMLRYCCGGTCFSRRSNAPSTGLPVPALTVSTSSINFGTILTATSSQEQITLSSTGNDTLVISSIDFDLGVYSVDVNTPIELIPGASQVLTITFQPDGAGTFSGSLTIVSNSPSTPDIVSLSGDAETPVSYAGAIQPVWNSNCTNCHGSSAGLSLSSYTNLMLGSSSGSVVISGDGANSLIVRKLKGQAGSLMPLGGSALSASTITTIETWINQGALNN